MSQKNEGTELFLASVSFISCGFIDPGLKTTPDPPLSGLTIAGMPPPAQHLWLPPLTLSTQDSDTEQSCLRGINCPGQ